MTQTATRKTDARCIGCGVFSLRKRCQSCSLEREEHLLYVREERAQTASDPFQAEKFAKRAERSRERIERLRRTAPFPAPLDGAGREAAAAAASADVGAGFEADFDPGRFVR